MEAIQKRQKRRKLHWEHALGFAIAIVPVLIWLHDIHRIQACGQLTIVEVCK